LFGCSSRDFRVRRFFIIAIYGNLATVSRKIALADFGSLRLSCRLEWWLWGAVNIFFLIGFRSRIAITLNWLWAYYIPAPLEADHWTAIAGVRSSVILTTKGGR
jgi:hypothetical protein